MRQLTPQQVEKYLQHARVKPVLLDVREPFEFEICQLEDSVNLPLGHIPSEFEKLDPELEYVLICHHGIRSQRAGVLLAGNGFDSDKLINLAGGIDAWACDVAPDMPRY